MPWTEIALPALAGEFRAVSVGAEQFVALNEQGLFRFEVGMYPAVRLLLPAAQVAGRLADGRIRWTGVTYVLIGDPAVGGRPVPEPAAGVDGQTLRMDDQECRLEVLDRREGVRLTVEGFPQ